MLISARTLRALAWTACVSAAGASAVADTVYYRDGRSPVEGKVLEKTAEQVVLETKFGQVTIPMKDVLKIEAGKTSAEEFRERWDATDADDVDALLELAEWCEEKKLSRESKKVYRRIVDLDEDHEEARRELGFVKVDGKWVTKREADAAEKAKKDAERKEKAAASKAAAKSGSKSAGKSAGKTDSSGIDVGPFLEPLESNKQADTETSTSLQDFFGQQFQVMTSERFSMRLQMPAQETQRHLALAEKMHVICNGLFGLEPEFRLWQGQYVWFQVKQKGTYIDLVDWIDKNFTALSPEAKKFFKDGGGLISTQPNPISAKSEGGIPLEHAIANEVGNTWIDWYTRGAARPWMTEGFGAYTAILEFGVNNIWHSTNTKYEGRTEIAEKNSDAHLRLVCHDIIDGALEGPHPWNEFRNRGLNALDYADLAKSWSIIDFLMAEHRETFHEYLKKLPGYQDEEAALRDVFGWQPEELEKRWKEYVLANYPKK